MINCSMNIAEWVSFDTQVYFGNHCQDRSIKTAHWLNEYWWLQKIDSKRKKQENFSDSNEINMMEILKYFPPEYFNSSTKNDKKI
jgi:hypothetical protein